MTAPEHSLLILVKATFAPNPPQGLGVAVSGGGDSLALLHLLARWRAEGGPDLAAVTVDHRLRPEAAAEAAFVAEVCKGLVVPHTTLIWEGWDGRGNLPDQARRARYRLIADWARGRGLAQVALGHTMDDQAETFLMRLARGSGVDGLAAMTARRKAHGIIFLRPLMRARRDDLRTYLRARGVAWVEDPTNDDGAYQRVQARRALEVLAPLGITAESLVATAHRLDRARDALDRAAHDLARAAARIRAGDVILRRDLFDAAPVETQARLLAHALRWIASADYRPRFAALGAVMRQIAAGRRATLHGCLVMPRRGGYHITREGVAVEGEAAPAALWDGRWHVSGPQVRGISVRALGKAGLAQLPVPRDRSIPEASLLAQPALWQGDRLVGAPLAGWANGWSAELARGEEDFFTSLITH